MSVDGVIGQNLTRGLLSEATGTTPVHTFLNRKLPSLTLDKDTIKNAPGAFDFAVTLKAAPVAQQNYAVTGTVTISEGVVSYSFENSGAAFAVNGYRVPAGTFTYGGSTEGLDSVCAILLGLSDSSSPALKLGLENGTVSTDAAESLQAWANAQSEDGTYTATEPYVLPTTPDGAVYNSDTKQYEIRLAAGQSFTFQHLPYGVSYEASELTPTGWELVSSANTSGTLDTDITASFVNQRLPDLTIAKNVSGNQASRDKFFQITLEITGAEPGTEYEVDLTNACAVSGSNIATITANTGQTNPASVTADADGKITASFYLQHGQSVTIQKLPYGVGYTVSETEEDYRPNLEIDGDTKTGDIDAAAGADITTGEGINIAKDNYLTDDTTLTFTNSRIGIVPTGVDTSVDGRLPMIIALLAGSLLLSVLYLGRKKRSYV